MSPSFRTAVSRKKRKWSTENEIISIFYIQQRPLLCNSVYIAEQLISDPASVCLWWKCKTFDTKCLELILVQLYKTCFDLILIGESHMGA